MRSKLLVVLCCFYISTSILAVPAYPDRQHHPSSHRTGLIISEIMYNPLEELQAKKLEFVELFNTESVPIDISGYALTGNIEYIFPVGTIINARSYLVICEDLTDFTDKYIGKTALGPYTGQLSNTDGKLKLINKLGAIMLDISYTNTKPWPEKADGAGHSLVLSKPDFGEGDVAAWDASQTIGGSPGEQIVTTTYGITFNEILANSPTNQSAFVELFNPNPQTINLKDCYLTDDPQLLKHKILSEQTIAAGGFIKFNQSEFASSFSLNPSGGRIFLVSADAQRILAASKYPASEIGTSIGLYPDGLYELTPLQSPTPATQNSLPNLNAIIINEIMYSPISGANDDEYIELYNNSANPIDLSGWLVSDAVNYQIPDDTIISAYGYIVIAKDALNLINRYSTLSALNTVGNYAGQLSNRRETIRISKPSTQFIGQYIEVDKVSYRDGDDWGLWSDAGGSSLELKNPEADNRFSSNWAGSNEKDKAPWSTISITGKLDHGMNVGINTIEVMLFDAGEVLLDDIEVTKQGETNNRIEFGDFESGDTGWLCQGNHIESSVIDNRGVSNSKAMLVKASGSGNNSVNRLRTTLAPDLANGDIATISYKARWQSGCQLLLIKLHGNYLDACEPLELPAELGTPGALNSCNTSDYGPHLEQVTHAPILPVADQEIIVSAVLADNQEITSSKIFYRLDPSSTYSEVLMDDNGTLGDKVANDSIYSGKIPGQATGTLIAFYIEATNQGGQTIRYPKAIDRECLIKIGDEIPEGLYSSYKFWMTAAAVENWRNDQKMSNRLQPATYIYGNFRAVYAASIRKRGSTWVRSQYTDPINFKCNYLAKVPSSDRVMGTKTINLDALEQQDVWSHSTRDPSFMCEKMSFWLGEKIGVPTLYMRHINMYINGQKQGIIYAETQQVNSDFVKSWYPNGQGGDMHEVSHWHEYASNADCSRQATTQAQLADFTTTDGAKKKARYRWNWKKERYSAYDDNYENLYNLVDEARATSDYYNRVDKVMNWQEWMRAIAVRQAVSDWDGYGVNNGQNCYIYKPANGGKWQFILFDVDTGLGVQGGSPQQDLFTIQDPTLKYYLFNEPTFLRAYYRALQDLVEGPMPQFGATIDSYVAGLIESGINIDSDSTSRAKNWVTARIVYINTILNGVENDFAITSNGGNNFSTANNKITLTGSAPLKVNSFSVNNLQYPVIWTGTTTWSVEIGLMPGDNFIELICYDLDGEIIENISDSITITYTGSIIGSAELVINEIMYNPINSDHEFLELHNISSVFPAQLSSYTIPAINVDFLANGNLIAKGYGVVVRNVEKFQEKYGYDINIIGTYSGKLSNEGEEIQLIKTTNGKPSVEDCVYYKSSWPWPTLEQTTDVSLQLYQDALDNYRPASWGINTQDPANPGFANNLLMPEKHVELWLNEIMIAGTNNLPAELEAPWLELYYGAQISGAVVDQTIINKGSNWKYLDNGTDQGTAWCASDFNDSSWVSGPAELGYGEGDEATIISYGPDDSQKYPTTYFRQTFEIDDASSVASLTVSYKVDDGAIIYLNGNQVLNYNMPASFNYLSYATGNANENIYFSGPLNKSFLVNGQNVLAVEVHQSTGTSSDLSFDLGIQAEVTLGASMTDYYLSPNPNNLKAWQLPSEMSCASGAFKVIVMDGNASTSSNQYIHTDFLAAGQGQLYLSHIAGTTTQILDCIDYPSLKLNQSYGSFPDSQSYNRVGQYKVTPEAKNIYSNNYLEIYINEWMAANKSTIQDPSDGSYADWIEIYNPANESVDLSQYTLSDSISSWKFPFNTTILANGFLVIWADNQANQTNGLHASFKLSSSGELLNLSADGQTIDQIVYAAMADDQSFGRWEDGAATIFDMHPPTPGSPNEIPEPAIFMLGLFLFLCKRLRV